MQNVSPFKKVEDFDWFISNEISLWIISFGRNLNRFWAMNIAYGRNLDFLVYPGNFSIIVRHAIFLLLPIILGSQNGTKQFLSQNWYENVFDRKRKFLYKIHLVAWHNVMCKLFIFSKSIVCNRGTPFSEWRNSIIKKF